MPRVQKKDLKPGIHILPVKMESIHDRVFNLFDLAVVDPPYNLKLKYAGGYNDNQTKEEYARTVKFWVASLARILKMSGSVFWFINEENHCLTRTLLEAQGFHWRNTIIWNYDFGSNQKHKFNPAHTVILYMVRDPSFFYFDRDSILIPSARQEVYNDKRASEGGKTPDDVWRYSRVCGTFHERVAGVPTQLPFDLVKRIVLTGCPPGGWVVDPFCGSGTTASVCDALERNCLTVDQAVAYTNIAKDRLNRDRALRKSQPTDRPNHTTFPRNEDFDHE
jgi:DNA modification methylase